MKKKEKSDFFKFKTFVNTIKKVKREPTEWENYLQIIYLIRDLYLENIKNSCNSTIKRQIVQFKNEQMI